MPAGYRPRYHPDGTLAALEPEPGYPPRVTAPHLPELAPYPTHSHILAPQSEWGEMFLVETGRGCSRGCRFCAAGFVYRPPRERPLEELWTQVGRGPMEKRKVGLVGAAVSDHPEVKELCRKILAAGGDIGISSLRADSVDEELFRPPGPRRGAERRPGPGGRQRPLTPGLEQGPQPGRPGPGRGGPEPGRHAAVAPLLHGGPAHRDPGGRGGNPPLVRFLEHRVVKDSQGKRRLGLITLSLSSFVPKPFTPFQWVPFLEVAELKKRLKLVTREFHGVKEVRVHTDLPKWAYVQALLARGDRRVGDILLAGPPTRLEPGLPGKPGEPGLFHPAAAPPDELFPWDFIDHGLKKDYLWEEYQRALEGKETPPCRPLVCKRCGICRVK